MAWETLSTDEVLALFNDSETDAYNTAKGDANGADLGIIIGFVVNELVEAISGRDIVLGPAGTIPAGFKKKAIGAVRYEFLNALPTGKSLLTEERVKAKGEYDALLKGIQDGSIKVQPGDGSGTAMALPAIKHHKRHFKPWEQEGL